MTGIAGRAAAIRAAAAQRAAMEILEAFFICDDGAPSPDTVGFGAPLSLELSA